MMAELTQVVGGTQTVTDRSPDAGPGVTFEEISTIAANAIRAAMGDGVEVKMESRIYAIVTLANGEALAVRIDA